MYRLIKAYAAQWDPQKNEGRFIFDLGNGRNYILPVEEAGELNALATVLREEKPVFIHTGNGQISTSWEPTGEGES